MNVAIVGFEVEGKAAFAYWDARGATITVCDRDPHKHIPANIPTQLGDDYLQDLGRFDLIVRSAGIPPDVILKANPGIDARITTVVDEFLRVCPTKNVIGITGTKGKGTTSTLVTHMLEAAGKHVFLGGNIGLAPFDFLDEVTADDWAVLELSSFQLSDIKHSPHIAACLILVPEHINWHHTFEEYVNAKAHIFAYQKHGDIAIFDAANEASRTIAQASKGTKIPYFAAPGAHVSGDEIVIGNQVVCKTSELSLLGKHNWENACAAVTIVWQAVPDASASQLAAMRQALASFAGLRYRLEFIREIDGVKYYDDTLGTTPESAIGALSAFDQPKVIILGGESKGVGFDELARVAATANVRTAVLVGETADEIETALRAAGFPKDKIVPGGQNMAQIVDAARTAAKPGDVVLLAPACTSFDMFKDYKDRGDQFNQAVSELR